MTPGEVQIAQNQLGVSSGKGAMFINRLIMVLGIDRDEGCCVVSIGEEMRVKHLRGIHTGEDNFRLYPSNLSLQVF